mgnify:CR=1 FL=1|tara:strand:- start:9630 stop:10004 length:375 start_codon:yes stop_codon:yes gene_type:complete
MLYKGHYEAAATNIEEERSGVSQYYSVSIDTNGATGVEIVFKHQFTDTEYNRVSRGYIINDDTTNSILVSFKFSKNLSLAYSMPVLIRPGQKLDLYPLSMISAMDITNEPAASADVRPFRIFAT